MSLKLIKLTRDYERELGEMIDEWRKDQEENHTNHSPYAIFKNDYHDLDYYLENLEYKEESNGRVKDTVFFLLDDERNRLLGAVNIRHYLSYNLYLEGGHIGDGIRPSERRKGYATKMIQLALTECRKLGMDKVLIVCDKDNPGSARSIMNNGGVLENEITDSEGCLMQRYWIDISGIPSEKSVEHSCGAVVFREDNGERKYLLICGGAGFWGFPKGHIEEGETEEETALREIWEETGCEVCILDGFRTEDAHALEREGKPDTIKFITYFIASCEDPTINPHDSEVSEARWVDINTAEKLFQFESSKRILREADRFLAGMDKTASE